MPWLETNPVIERQRFVKDVESGHWTMSELCVRYGISRITGYKWLDRYSQSGVAGLQDHSRAPRSCPHKTPQELVELVLKENERYGWGARKILKRLRTRLPERAWPARSTIFDILKRHGRAEPRRRRRRWKHPGAAPFNTTAPNQVWTVDFKGQFLMRNGVYCYPLTIVDHFSRYLLCCHGLHDVRTEGVQPQFLRLFREHGLPGAIRSDNGAPFASTGIHGLSRLNVWWLQLGITHQRITPGSPQQNGAHERMHKTLKRGACRPPRATLGTQQRAFNRFRQEYNEERPHQFLRGRTPSALYRVSPRAYTGLLPALEYPSHLLVKRVTNAGTIRFKTRLLYLSTALRQHRADYRIAGGEIIE